MLHLTFRPTKSLMLHAAVSRSGRLELERKRSRVTGFLNNEKLLSHVYKQ